MATKTEISNMAISHLGTGMTIANLETESSEEAEACRTFFDTALDSTLREFDWPFARVFKELSLVKEAPTPEWGFAYRYPSDCKMIRKILSGVRNDTRESQVPYVIAKDAAGRLILADVADPVARYTEAIKDLSLCTSDFVMALSFKLAMYIAPKLTAGDPYKMKQEMQASYLAEISSAKALALNEEKREIPPESEFIRARY